MGVEIANISAKNVDELQTSDDYTSLWLRIEQKLTDDLKLKPRQRTYIEGYLQGSILRQLGYIDEARAVFDDLDKDEQYLNFELDFGDIFSAIDIIVTGKTTRADRVAFQLKDN